MNWAIKQAVSQEWPGGSASWHRKLLDKSEGLLSNLKAWQQVRTESSSGLTSLASTGYLRGARYSSSLLLNTVIPLEEHH